ncbi:hypothetical protein QAD02_000592 [Eretmocerus hayati]|uniref:Uncharacterized protein n=1 Tax=Eretmocerus hayati TaxID=131215 RepID=A0ACC2NEW7_9HYME|nr:hypothetical protein QAD02_000592 [Eretmocerus hayati]
MMRNDEDLIAFTGVLGSLLDSLTRAVNLCEDKRQKQRFKNSSKKRIVLCLCKLKLNLSLRCLEVLFAMDRRICSKIFEYMVDLMADTLQDFIYWPTYEGNQDNVRMSAQDTLYTNKIAAARVHVERAMQRLKTFHILKYKVALPIIPMIDKIATIGAALVNLKNPLLPKDKF